MQQESTSALIGIGKSNIALARFLLKKGIKITLRDKSCAIKIPNDLKNDKRVKIILGKKYLKKLTEDKIYLSPSVRPDVEELSSIPQERISSEIKLFAESCPCKIIAVTGSDGKTTTATLLSEILRHGKKRSIYLAGNIGTPPISFLDKLAPDDICVLELSSFQLMNFIPTAYASVITNITPNHLNWHKNFEEYKESKLSVYKNAEKTVINTDDEICNSLETENPIFVSVEKSYSEMKERCKEHKFICLHRGKAILCCGENKITLFSVSDVKMRGIHNILNLMLASALSLELASPEDIAFVASSFYGVSHRCEFVKVINGIEFYDSSIDSTPSRTKATLASFKTKSIVICGGADKNLPLDTLTEALIKHASLVVFTGANGRKMLSCLTESKNYKGSPETWYEEDFDKAILLAYQSANPGERVILSPAATSFDRFSNYIERSKRFRQDVEGLI